MPFYSNFLNISPCPQSLIQIFKWVFRCYGISHTFTIHAVTCACPTDPQEHWMAPYCGANHCSHEGWEPPLGSQSSTCSWAVSYHPGDLGKVTPLSPFRQAKAWMRSPFLGLHSPHPDTYTCWTWAESWNKTFIYLKISMCLCFIVLNLQQTYETIIIIFFFFIIYRWGNLFKVTQLGTGKGRIQMWVV